MKRIQIFLVLFTVFSILASILTVNVLAVDSISINLTKNLIVGDRKPLVLTGAEPDKVIWTSSNEAAATVNEKGIVTGISTGPVTITASLKANTSVTASVDLLIRTSYPYDVEWSGSFTHANNNTTTTMSLPTDPNRVQKVWDAQVGNNTVVIVDDYIYTYDGVDAIPEDDQFPEGILYKVDKTSGQVVDTLTIGVATPYYYSYIIYGGGLLYISCPGVVMAVDPDSFTLLWKSEVSFKTFSTIQFVNNCLVTNGTVLDSATGEKVKDLEGQSSFDWSSGVEVDGCFYVAGGNTLYAFDTATWTKTDELVFDGKGAGVIHNAGWLYWADKSSGKLHAVQLSGNALDDTTYTAIDCGYSTFGAPVAAGGRIYLAGYRPDGSLTTGDNDKTTGNAAVCVFSAANRSLIYKAELLTDGHKVQGTPILSVVSSGGNVVAEVNFPIAAENGTVFVYLQDYAYPGTVYMLEDDNSKTSGSLTKLVEPDPGDFAYEQLACDKDGSLYITNDAGFLQKYQTAKVSAPVISGDLSTGEVTYGQNGTADALSVSAASADGGTISYQWQSRMEGGVFTDISGATGSSFTPSTEYAGTIYYRCVVTSTLSGEKATVNSKVAKITVVARQIANGDTNGDGTVDAKDVTVLRRYLAGWSVEIHLNTADINGDGEVNAKDVTVLRRQLAS